MHTSTKVRPTTMRHALYRDPTDQLWYWTLDPEHPESTTPIGPFKTREAARDDFRNVMGIKKGDYPNADRK